MRPIIFFALFSFEILSGAPLTLDEALTIAKDRSIDLKIKEIEQDAAYGDSLQASLRPNPLFSVDVGTIGFDDLSDNDEGSIIYELEQLVELGGKRAARMCLSQVEQEKVNLAYNIAFSKLQNDVKNLYRSLQIEELNLKLQNEKVDIAKTLLEKEEEKLKNGTISFQQFSHRIKPLHTYTFKEEDAKQRVKEIKNHLEMVLGGELNIEDISPFNDDISNPTQVELPLESLLAFKERALTVEAAARLYNLEESMAVPDIAIRFDVEQQRRSAGFLVGATIPLPVFNRNEGNRCKAWALWRKAEMELQAFQKAFKREIDQSYNVANLRYLQAIRAKEKIVFMAENRLNAILEKQKLGTEDEEAYLEAKLLQIEANEGYLDLLSSYFESLNHYENLTISCYE